MICCIIYTDINYYVTHKHLETSALRVNVKVNSMSHVVCDASNHNGIRQVRAACLLTLSLKPMLNDN